MGVKTLAGTYPDGYVLSPSYQSLNITESAKIYGPGVYASASAAVANLGTVQAQGDSAKGISLTQGGSLVNGSVSNTTAIVEGSVAVFGSHAYTSVKNFGVLKSDAATSTIPVTIGSPEYYYTYDAQETTALPTVILPGGSVVRNTGSSAVISNGILIAGGTGKVVNTGTVGGEQIEFDHTYYHFQSYQNDQSVVLQNGGSVINGSNTATYAELKYGVIIENGVGYVANGGTIGSPSYRTSGRYGKEILSPSIQMAAGGTVKNGTQSNTSATILNGISIGAATGKVVNYGTIGAPTTYTYNKTYKRASASVVLGDGGSVTNGSASATSASIEAGITITGAAGTIDNFGTIGGPTYTYYGRDTQKESDFAVLLTAGGKVKNEATGTINGIKIFGAGNVVNAGTINSPATYGYLTAKRQVSVQLLGGGSVSNAVGGTINGLTVASARGVVVNHGTINGATSNDYSYTSILSSVDVQAGGTVTNGGATDSKATLTNGVELAGAGTVTNYGVIGKNSNGVAVSLSDANSTFIEEGTGSITGKVIGSGSHLVFGSAAGPGVISGLGSTITGFADITIQHGTLWQLASATIGSDVRNFDVDGSVQLTGTTDIDTTVTGDGFVVFLQDSATLDADAKIKAANFQVVLADVTFNSSIYYTGTFSERNGSDLTLTGDSTLTLAGPSRLASSTIDGSGRLKTTGPTTVLFMTFSGAASWINYGNVTETGGVTLGASSTLNNAAGATFALAGNFGISAASGAMIYNAGDLVKTAGTGVSTIAGPVKNTGTIEAAIGTLNIGGALTGTGGMTIDTGAVLELGGSVGTGQTIAFGSSTGELVLDDVTDFDGALTGFAVGAKLDVTNFSSSTTSISFVENANSTSGVLHLTDGADTALIMIAGNHNPNQFHLASDGHGGSVVTYGNPGSASLTEFGAALLEATFSQPSETTNLAPQPHASTVPSLVNPTHR